MRQRMLLVLLSCGLALGSASADAKPVVQMTLHATDSSFPAGTPPRFKLDFVNVGSQKVRIHLNPSFLVCLAEDRERHATLVMTVAPPEAPDQPIETRFELAPSESESLEAVATTFSPLMPGAREPLSFLEPGRYVAACLHRGLHQKITLQAGAPLDQKLPKSLRAEFSVVAPD